MKVSNILKVVIVLAALVVIAPILPGLLYIGVAVMFGPGDDHTFEPQWKKGFQESNTILIANGLCSIITRPCLDKNTMYVMGIPAGFKVDIYGVADQKLLGQLSETFTKEFSETPSMKHLVIHAYAFTRQEAGSFPFIKEWLAGTVLDVDMRRQK